MRTLIQSVSDRYSMPNNTHGYGVPNFCMAYNLVLGVDDFEQKTEELIDVYPNPANNQVKIRVKQSMLPYDIQFLDLSGRVVYQENGIKSLNYTNGYIQNFPKGTYFIRLQSKSNKVAKSKLIIE